MERGEERISQPPAMPAGLLGALREELGSEDAPFLRHLDEHLDLEWLPAGETRLGVTRFECNHNELYRRRRLKAPPGPVTIALNPILSDDENIYIQFLATRYIFEFMVGAYNIDTPQSFQHFHSVV